MKILVLAGGFDQIELIKKLKCKGNIVYLVDYFQNPLAKDFVDKHFEISTLDEEAVYKIALEENIEMITTACTDQALLTVANVSERLNLPCYITAEKAIKVTNKSYMKQCFQNNKINTAPFIIIENEKLWDQNKDIGLQYPLIVKPCDCNSSKGVVKVGNIAELDQAVKNAFFMSRSKKVIIEEFIDGIEISIDVWKDEEDAKILSISKSNKMKNNIKDFTIYQSVYPVLISEKVKKEIKRLAIKICKAFELNNCPLLIQAIVTENNVFVVEFSARMGGGSKYKFIEYMSGIDIMDIYVNRILGDESQIVNPIASSKFMELNYVYAKNGIYQKSIGFESEKEGGQIAELFYYKREGEEITGMKTSSDRIMGFLLVGESNNELLQLRKKIMKNVDIINDLGESIMFKDCFDDNRHYLGENHGE